MGLTAFLILFATICLMIGASFLNVSQTREQNQHRLVVATQSVQRTITRMLSRDAYTLAAFSNKRNVTVMFKGILLSNYVRPEIPVILSDLGIALNAEHIGFYRPLQDQKQFQLNQYYSRALQGTVVLTRKEGALEQRLYTKDEKGLVTTSIVEREPVFPETFSSQAQAYLLECSGDQCLLSMEIPYLSAFDDENYGLEKGEVLGTFLIKKNLEVNLNELDQDMGVSFNLYGLTGQMGQGQVALPDMDFAAPDFAVNQFIERVDRQGERYDALIVPLNYQHLKLGYLSGSISQKTTELKVRATIRLQLTIALAILGASLVASWFTVTGFVKPIIRIVKLTQRIAAGDFTETLTAKDLARADEIGILGRAFNSMASQLNALIVSLEQRLAELDRTGQALRLSSERLKLATRVTRIGIWDWDVVENKLLWDDSMYPLYGIQAEEFGGAYEAWARTIHPEDRAHAEGEIQAALRGEREYAPEFRIIRPDGAIRYIKADSMTIHDRDGKPLRMIGTNIDITERKEAEMEIRTLNQELEQRVAERTAQLETAIYDLENFNYSASHDLRIPLRAINGYSRILLDEYAEKLDEEGIRLLNVVRENTNRLAHYIDDMQAFSRTGKMAMAPVEIDMERLVRDVMEELKPARAGRNIELEIDSLPSVYADRPMLRWVFVNLLSNAIKFSRTQATPHIKVGAAVEANETLYFVQDNGVGFDMQYADKLFGVFERLHSVNEFEGTGIGLAIVKRIISRHGGRVWAESKVNEGATIYFALPHRENKEDATGEANEI